MPKLECMNYNSDLKISKVYKEFVLKVCIKRLACNVYRRWIIFWKEIILQDNALGIKLKVIQSKHKNIKIIKIIRTQDI
jgi:hypothetical protein